ncbi:MAG: hypothetical protein KatS3mg035_0881 [Bacteroidia bacterium]|nr:MAG: hypothetical protein KatS3mg035_0881 [Bacteroidia bacterium]
MKVEEVGSQNNTTRVSKETEALNQLENLIKNVEALSSEEIKNSTSSIC